jgi:hypothetical protein
MNNTMENEFYTRTPLERVYNILVEARRLGATSYETNAVLDLIARHKDLEKNLIKSAFMSGRDFQAEHYNKEVYFEDSAEDYFNENHTQCTNTKQN